jgi:hypothetical protein
MAGRSISDLGRTVQRAGFLLQEKREDSFARDYMTRLDDGERKLLHDPRTGLYKQEGSQAWKTTDKVSGWWEGHLKKIDELPVGQRAKDRLKQSMMVRRGNSLDHASRFEADQDRVYRDRVFEAEYRSVLDDALTNWDQPDMLAWNVEDLTQEIQARYGPEETKTQIAAMKDRIWGTAIIQAAKADARTGLAMLDKIKTQLSPAVENRVRESLKQMMDKLESEQAAAGAYRELSSIYKNNADTALKYLSKSEAVRKYGLEVVEKTKVMFQSARAEQKASEQKARQEKEAALEQERRKFIRKFKEQTLTPGEVASSDLTTDDKKVWLSDIEKRADAHDKGRRDPFAITDHQVYGKESYRVSVSPETIKSVNEIWKFHGKGLSTQDCENLENKWRAWKEGRMELDLDLDAVYRRGFSFLEGMKEDGFFGDQASPEAAANFGRYVQMWDQYFEKMKGAEEKPSPEQAREFLQEMVTPDLEERIAEMYPDQELDNKSGSHDNDDRNQDSGTGGSQKPDPTELDGDNPSKSNKSSNSQPLTDSEKNYLAPFIPKRDLDNAEIIIGKMPWYTPDWTEAIVRGNKIYFRDPNQTFNTPEDLALLGHELVHVGQYAEGMNWASYIWSARKGYKKDPYEVQADKIKKRILRELTKPKSSPLP